MYSKLADNFNLLPMGILLQVRENLSKCRSVQQLLLQVHLLVNMLIFLGFEFMQVQLAQGNQRSNL